MTDIQHMKSQLKARKGHCTRDANKVRTEITAEAANHRTLVSAIQRLEDKYSSHQKAYDELDIALLDADDSSRDEVELAFETYDTEINDLISQANKICDEKETGDKQTNQSPQATTSPCFSNNHIKLPSVKPIKFSGDLDKWTTFWSNLKR